MKVLAIHDGHNASVGLIEEGKIKFAIQEERFTYEKNSGGLPLNSINYIKENFGISEVDQLVFSSIHIPTYDWTKPTVLKLYEKSDSLNSILRHYVKNNEFIYRIYSKRTNEFRKKRISEVFPNHQPVFLDHHFGHAATAYYGLGNYTDEVLVITVDGDGDGKSAGIFLGKNGDLTELESLPAKHSVGRVYSYLTFLFNMVPFEHEYKIMGLAPYCKDRDRIEKCKKDFFALMNFNNDSDTFWRYKGTYPTVQSAGKEFKAVFENYRFDILSAALQEFTEDLLCETVNRAVSKYNIGTIALAGGVFMNVKANMLIAKLSGVNNVFVFPSCGDESLPIGAANYIYYKQTMKHPEPLEGFYFGDNFSVLENELNKLDKSKIEIKKENNIELKIAQLLANGEIVGRVKGRMEFGARALGNRSILANPSIEDVLRTINDMIKNRDFWMPFAPSVLAEDISDYFFIDNSVLDYQYMIFTCESKPEKRKYARNALHPYDFTGRPQAVRREHNADYHSLISEYKKITGESLILNTSYNLHGFPIVRTQEQALHVFLESGLNYLALDNYLLIKKN